jgi:hypothetical protein
MPRAIALSGLLVTTALLAAPALAQAQGADRYGPSAGAPPASAPYAPATTLRGRMLSWPGKTDVATSPQTVAPPVSSIRYAPAAGYAPRAGAPAYAAQLSQARAYPSQPYAVQGYPAQAYAAPAPAPRVQPPGGVRSYAGLQSPPQGGQGADGWRPVYAAPPALSGAPARPEALPTSLYTPAKTPVSRAALAPPPRAVSAAQRYGYDPTQDHAVHFYSVHRPFGLQPDPAPIPPQFFGATADLSEPPAQPPEERTASASGGRTARAIPDTSVQ